MAHNKAALKYSAHKTRRENFASLLILAGSHPQKGGVSQYGWSRLERLRS